MLPPWSTPFLGSLTLHPLRWSTMTLAAEELATGMACTASSTWPQATTWLLR